MQSKCVVRVSQTEMDQLAQYLEESAQPAGCLVCCRIGSAVKKPLCDIVCRSKRDGSYLLSLQFEEPNHASEAIAEGLRFPSSEFTLRQPKPFRPKRRPKPMCSRCLRQGHSASNCRAATSQLKCRVCGGVGHCSTNARKNNAVICPKHQIHPNADLGSDKPYCIICGGDHLCTSHKCQQATITQVETKTSSTRQDTPPSATNTVTQSQPAEQMPLKTLRPTPKPKQPNEQQLLLQLMDSALQLISSSTMSPQMKSVAQSTIRSLCLIS